MRRLPIILIVVLLHDTSSAADPALLLFGGEGRSHDTFLGCLNCGKYDASSVCNKFEEQGNKFSTDSIWNKFGTYGNKFSLSSPWNKFTVTPPAIVDRDGNFYGYFTANKNLPKRTSIKFFLIFLNNADEVVADMDRARDLFCQ